MQGAAQRAVGPRKGRYGLAARIAGGGGKERHEHEHEACRCARDAVLFSLGDLFLLAITCALVGASWVVVAGVDFIPLKFCGVLCNTVCRLVNFQP